MMKKNGFTLAEVLITLAIIGVVATMTLPTLMTNTGEQQYKTGLKKGINILTEAAQMHETLEGFNYSSLNTATDVSNIDQDQDEKGSTINPASSLGGLLKERTKIDTKTTKALNGGDDVTYSTAGKTTTNQAVIAFIDGTSLVFDSSTVANNAGFNAIFDTNGEKGPNQVSNCLGATGKNGGDDSAKDVTECKTKANRMIKDQFQINLDGTVVQPVGAAATWAFAN